MTAWGRRAILFELCSNASSVCRVLSTNELCQRISLGIEGLLRWPSYAFFSAALLGWCFQVKETGQRAVEELLAAKGLPWTSFRPQYIYGPKTNKRDYVDWYYFF